LEPALARTESGVSFQLERLGYFCLDSKDSTAENLVLNRTTPLRDSWAKLKKKG
jgi:glutaminyl-tRNA synthetase